MTTTTTTSAITMKALDNWAIAHGFNRQQAIASLVAEQVLPYANIKTPRVFMELWEDNADGLFIVRKGKAYHLPEAPRGETFAGTAEEIFSGYLDLDHDVDLDVCDADELESMGMRFVATWGTNGVEIVDNYGASARLYLGKDAN